MSGKPSRASLPNVVTLWNAVTDGVVNGARVTKHQRTIIRHVRTETSRKTRQSDNSAEDTFFMLVFNGVSVATDKEGTVRKYAHPEVFGAMTEEEKAAFWTIQAGDRVSVGVLDGEPDQHEAYLIDNVTPHHGARADVHHWEVQGS